MATGVGNRACCPTHRTRRRRSPARSPRVGAVPWSLCLRSDLSFAKTWRRLAVYRLQTLKVFGASKSINSKFRNCKIADEGEISEHDAGGKEKNEKIDEGMRGRGG